MAAPAPAPVRASGPPVPPAVLQQMMRGGAAQAAQAPASAAPPPIPPQVLQQLIAAKAQQAQAPQGGPSQAGGAIPPQVLQQLAQKAQGGQAQPQGAPPPQGGQPQPQQPPPQPQSAPQPPGALAGQQAAPPPPGLPNPGASGQQAPGGKAPGQMPSDMPPELMQQMMAQRGKNGATGGDDANNPPQLPQQVVQQMANGGKPQAPQGQGKAPDISQIPPAIMQQMVAAKQAIANGQPLPNGPVPPQVLQSVISHTALLDKQVQENGGQPPTQQQFQQASLQHVALAHSLAASNAPVKRPGMAAFAQMAQQRPGTPTSSSSNPPAPYANAPASVQASKGQGQDRLMAHMTPGEIAVPPALQSPQVMAVLQQAFAKGGANVSQFTAGSKSSSINPQTGKPQFDFLSTVLPMVVMAGVAVFAPELLPAAGWAVPLLVGAAGAATSLATGASWQQALMTGAGGAVGGYAAGLGSAAAGSAAGSAAATDAAASAVDSAAASSAGAGTNLAATGALEGTESIGASTLNTGALATQGALDGSYSTGTLASTGAGQGGAIASAATPAAATPAAASTTAANTATKAATDAGSKGMLGDVLGKELPFGAGPGGVGAATVKQVAYPLLGASMLGSLAPATTDTGAASAASQLPPGFATHKPAATTDFGGISGSHVASTPTFQDYNPYQAVTGVDPNTGKSAQAGYSFFPQAGQSPIAQNSPIVQPNMVQNGMPGQVATLQPVQNPLSPVVATA